VDKSMVIIGAGVAGLAAGCYALMNGYRTQILEMHTLPGSVCTSWKRKGYTFDGCIHHLAGCAPDSRLYGVWEEPGAMPRPVLFPEELVSVADPGGQTLTVYTDLERLEYHLQELSPADARLIEEYVRAVRSFARVDLMDLPVIAGRDVFGTLLAMLGLSI